MRTIPLAVLSAQEGGGLEDFTVTVLPAGEFSVTETQVLLQPAAQSKQAVSGRKLDDTREGKLRGPWRNRIIVRREGKVKEAT